MSIILGDPGEKSWTNIDTPPPSGRGRVRATRYRYRYRYKDVYRIFILGVWNAFMARYLNA